MDDQSIDVIMNGDYWDRALRVCISVVNWNGYERTIQCLSALIQQTYSNTRIVVIDNASSDGSATYIRQAFPSVDLLEAKSNLGYAGGNRLALQYALRENFDLFWIVNNDVLVEADTLFALVDAFRVHGDAIYGSVSFAPEERSKELPDRRVMMPVWELGPDGEPNYQRLILHQPFQRCFPTMETRAVANVIGSSLLIPLAVVQQFGFLDTSYFLYWEEVDYCFRLRKLGIPSLLVPKSHIYHDLEHAHKHDPCLKPIVTYYDVRNRLLWTRRHRSAKDYLREVVGVCMFTALRYIAPFKRGLSAFAIALYATRAIVDAVLDRRGKTVAPEEYCRSDND